MHNVLNNKVALVTGAGRGIGRSIALAYSEAGAAVCAVARTGSEIEETAKEIREKGGQAITNICDVASYEDVQLLFQRTVAELGGLDIVVLNAGVNVERNSVEESDPQKWREAMEINLFGVYYCAKAAIPYMKEHGGKIIVTGSGMGHRGAPGSSAYCCSKAGAWMLVQVLAQELAEYNISVNELIPGPVDTAMTSDTTARSGVAFTTGSEWIKEPDDVVPLALFLASQPEVGPTAQSFSLMRRNM